MSFGTGRNFAERGFPSNRIDSEMSAPAHPCSRPPRKQWLKLKPSVVRLTGLRPDLPRQGQLEQDAVVHPSRAARHARAVHRRKSVTRLLTSSATRGQLPALARAGSGARHHAQRRRSVDQLRQAHRGRTPREHGARGCGFQRDAVQGEDR